MLKNNYYKDFFTPTVLRNAIWNTIVIILVFIIFNVFSLISLNYFLIENIDTRIRHEVEHIALSIKYENDQLTILNPNELRESDLAQMTEDPFLLQVFTLDKKILLQSDNLDGFEKIPLQMPEFKGEYFFKDIPIKEHDLRTGYTHLLDENKIIVGFIQVSAFNDGFQKLTVRMFYFNLVSLPLILIIVALVSLYLSQRSLRRIRKIIALANEISATNISERIYFDSDSLDIVGSLKDTLNNLFDRLESQIYQISDFTDNASHQLMTPLTTINNEIDYLLKLYKSDSGLKESLLILKKKTKKIIEIVRTLLLFARNCEDCNKEASTINVNKLFKDQIIPMYSSNKIKINYDKESFVSGNIEFLTMAFTNLIDNAIKYSDGKLVDVSFEKEMNYISIIISDQGCGISEEEKTKIFNRFYRGEKIDSRKIEGNGLGLSMVQMVITSMKGEILIRDNHPKGTIFTVKLPIIQFGK